MKPSVWEMLIFKNAQEFCRAYDLLKEHGFEVESESMYRQLCKNQALDHLEISAYMDQLNELNEEQFEDLLEEMVDELYSNSRVDDCLSECTSDAVNKVLMDKDLV